MIPIKNRVALLLWLRKRSALDARRKKLEKRIRRINDSLLAYYERKNLTEVPDPQDGALYSKRQATTQVWDDAALKKLLARKKIPLELVFQDKVIEVRDDKAIFQLMQDEMLSLDDIESVSELQQHRPYIIRVGKKNGKNESDDEEG